MKKLEIDKMDNLQGGMPCSQMWRQIFDMIMYGTPSQSAQAFNLMGMIQSGYTLCG